jgi:hypothetical protein
MSLGDIILTVSAGLAAGGSATIGSDSSQTCGNSAANTG